MTETLQGSLLAWPGLCKQDLDSLQRQAVLQWEDDGVSPSHTEEQQGRGTTRGTQQRQVSSVFCQRL